MILIKHREWKFLFLHSRFCDAARMGESTVETILEQSSLSTISLLLVSHIHITEPRSKQTHVFHWCPTYILQNLKVNKHMCFTGVPHTYYRTLKWTNTCVLVLLTGHTKINTIVTDVRKMLCGDRCRIRGHVSSVGSGVIWRIMVRFASRPQHAPSLPIPWGNGYLVLGMVWKDE